MRPEFHPELASVRIRSSVQLLQLYIGAFHPIEFSLRSGDDIIGQTYIPLHKIVQPLQQESRMDKLFDILTEEYQLRLSPSSRHEKVETIEDENSQPIVKLEVKLTRETSTTEQRSRKNKQHRKRSSSADNTHHSSVSFIDNDNR